MAQATRLTSSAGPPSLLLFCAGPSAARRYLCSCWRAPLPYRVCDTCPGDVWACRCTSGLPWKAGSSWVSTRLFIYSAWSYHEWYCRSHCTVYCAGLFAFFWLENRRRLALAWDSEYRSTALPHWNGPPHSWSWKCRRCGWSWLGLPRCFSSKSSRLAWRLESKYRTVLRRAYL